jgi:hypothetical protein
LTLLAHKRCLILLSKKDAPGTKSLHHALPIAMLGYKWWRNRIDSVLKKYTILVMMKNYVFFLSMGVRKNSWVHTIFRYGTFVH